MFIDTKKLIRGDKAMSWESLPKKEDFRKAVIDFFDIVSTQGPDEAFRIVSVAYGEGNKDGCIANLKEAVERTFEDSGDTPAFKGEWYEQLKLPTQATDEELNLKYEEASGKLTGLIVQVFVNGKFVDESAEFSIMEDSGKYILVLVTIESH